MTDPTTIEGRAYWAERRRLEEWRERESSHSVCCACCGAHSPIEHNACPDCGCDRPLRSCFDRVACDQIELWLPSEQRAGKRLRESGSKSFASA
ncbi:MAG TPA: hypothetical protein VJ810_07690 [Blastocatellia bacterium]|nr:hypothetical protein [Blastocatellia bacterium]